MKKIFEVIGLLSLVCFSFFVTDKTATVVKNVDDIMVRIKSEQNNYKIDSVDAEIKDNYITAGLSGRKVNVNKSYKAMKEFGQYNDELYVYDDIAPKVSIASNKDKIVIGGNKQKRQISLIFILNSDSDISNILNILDNNEVIGNFFVDAEWLTNNNYSAMDLIDHGYTLGNLSHNQDYQDSSFKWIDTIIKHVGKQRDGYCLYKDNDSISLCKNIGNYTIRPMVVDNNPLVQVKENISNGSLIAFSDSHELYSVLDTVIKYIKSKGYEVVSLENILKE